MIKDHEYNGKDVSIIIPTKDRPQKIERLLTSLLNQKKEIGEIIIVSTGKNISKIVKKFKNIINIKHIHTKKGGQIFQRNIGIQNLDGNTRLVATLDDDIFLFEDAMEKILKFFNNNNNNRKKIAGVGFNIINEPMHKPSRLKTWLRFTGKNPGEILKSGFNTSLCNVEKDISTQYLNGGATIWKKEFLFERVHKEINSKWAVAEDLIFSYPIGKEYNLYICSDAKVIHEHSVDQFEKGSIYTQKGKNLAMWRLYFVTENEDLSIFSYIWGTLIGSIGIIFESILKKNTEKIFFGFGLMYGAFIGIYRFVVNKQNILGFEK